MRTRVASVVLLASLALAAAGCGGNNPGTKASGASLIRSNVLAFLSVNSDLQSSQWSTVTNLVRKFPSGSKLLSQLQTATSSQGVSYKRDIAPALGPEVDFVLTSVSTSGISGLTSPSSASFVVMTKPKDEGKLKTLLAKAAVSGSKPVYKKVSGWYILSTSQSNIDQALHKGGKSLGDEGSFQRALKALPKNALVKAYLSGSSLKSLLQSASTSSTLSPGSAAGALGNLDFVGLALSAENDGFRLEVAAKGGAASSLSSSSTYISKLASTIPSGALGVISFRGSKSLTSRLQKALQNSAYGAQVQQLQATLGVTTQQLFALLEHEIAFYVRPSGAKLPEFTLLLEAPQEAQELSTVDTLMTKIARLSGGAPITAPGGGKTVKLGKYSVTYGGFDSRVILTTAPKGVADAQSTGPKLSSDPAFNEAKAAAHVPDKTGGFLYVNLKDSIPLIEAYEAAQGKQISANTQANLAPLKSVFAFASAKGGVGKFTIFLEIK